MGLGIGCIKSLVMLVLHLDLFGQNNLLRGLLQGYSLLNTQNTIYIVHNTYDTTTFV